MLWVVGPGDLGQLDALGTSCSTDFIEHPFTSTQLVTRLKRLLLMVPTLIGIMLISFAIIQFAPGGPIEQIIARIQGTGTDATEIYALDVQWP